VSLIKILQAVTAILMAFDSNRMLHIKLIGIL